MPPTKSRWDKRLNQATVWIGDRDVLITLDDRGRLTWDGPGSYSAVIDPTKGNPDRVLEFLEALRDTFRDAAISLRETRR